MHANNRKFASALISLDPDAAAAWAKERGKPTDVASLSRIPTIAYIGASVDELNSKLNKWGNDQEVRDSRYRIQR